MLRTLVFLTLSSFDISSAMTTAAVSPPLDWEALVGSARALVDRRREDIVLVMAVD